MCVIKTYRCRVSEFLKNKVKTFFVLFVFLNDFLIAGRCWCVSGY